MQYFYDLPFHTRPPPSPRLALFVRHSCTPPDSGRRATPDYFDTHRCREGGSWKALATTPVGYQPSISLWHPRAPSLSPLHDLFLSQTPAAIACDQGYNWPGLSGRYLGKLTGAKTRRTTPLTNKIPNVNEASLVGRTCLQNICRQIICSQHSCYAVWACKRRAPLQLAQVGLCRSFNLVHISSGDSLHPTCICVSLTVLTQGL